MDRLSTSVRLGVLIGCLVLGGVVVAIARSAVASTPPRQGLTGGVTLGFGGALQRGQSRWVFHGAARLGWIVTPRLQLLLDNAFYVNNVSAGPNNARFFTVWHAPLALVDLYRGLYVKGGLGFAYQFERGTKKEVRYGFVGIVGLGYRMLERDHFLWALEFQIAPVFLDKNGNHYLFVLGLAFQFD
ncbi:MAG: hypothetical protein KC609_10620 [Myxococcales bacterium]|nr:hypothetical protein [Myxococcales bacterium]